MSTTLAEVNIRVDSEMTSATIVEKSVTCTDNSPSQKYPHPDDNDTGLKNCSVYPHKLNILPDG